MECTRAQPGHLPSEGLWGASPLAERRKQARKTPSPFSNLKKNRSRSIASANVRTRKQRSVPRYGRGRYPEDDNGGIVVRPMEPVRLSLSGKGGRPAISHLQQSKGKRRKGKTGKRKGHEPPQSIEMQARSRKSISRNRKGGRGNNNNNIVGIRNQPSIAQIGTASSILGEHTPDGGSSEDEELARMQELKR